MARWYNSGVVYVCASKTEGTPNPALEAAACGCPIVSTKVGNMPELIKDGYNGYIVERSVDQLYNAILKTIKHKDEMSKNMQKAIADWDWAERSKVYYDLFRRLIKEKRG